MRCSPCNPVKENIIEPRVESDMDNILQVNSINCRVVNNIPQVNNWAIKSTYRSKNPILITINADCKAKELKNSTNKFENGIEYIRL